MTKNVEAMRGEIKNVVNSVSTNMSFLLIGDGRKKTNFFFEREDSKKLLGVFVFFLSEISGGGLGARPGWVRWVSKTKKIFFSMLDMYVLK